MDLSYRFCPSCGGTLELRLLKRGDPMRHVCTACGQVIYLDPKVAVGTIISDDDGRIVLVRRAIEPGYGLWVFPSGYVDRGEPVTTAAVREAKEEAGLDVALDALVNIYSYPGRPLIVIVYSATVRGGELCVDEECLEARWFTPDAIPWNDLAFPSTRDGLRHYLEGFRLQK